MCLRLVGGSVVFLRLILISAYDGGREFSVAMIGCGTSVTITHHVNFGGPVQFWVRIIRRVPNVLIGVLLAVMRCRL